MIDVRAAMEGAAHHVTQRGNRRQAVFFGDKDDRAWRAVLAEGRAVAVWGYCLTPYHVHPVMGPASADGRRAALGEAHRCYTRRVNLREGRRGYPWEGRFASVAMDEAHLMAAARHVEPYPARARLASWPRWFVPNPDLAVTGLR